MKMKKDTMMMHLAFILPPFPLKTGFLTSSHKYQPYIFHENEKKYHDDEACIHIT